MPVSIRPGSMRRARPGRACPPRRSWWSPTAPSSPPGVIRAASCATRCARASSRRSTGSTGTGERSSSTRPWPTSGSTMSGDRLLEDREAGADPRSAQGALGRIPPGGLRGPHRLAAARERRAGPLLRLQQLGLQHAGRRSSSRRPETMSSRPSIEHFGEPLGMEDWRIATATTTTNATSRCTRPIRSACRPATPPASDCSSPATACGAMSGSSRATG